MKALTALWRLLRVLMEALAGWRLIRRRFPGLTPPEREQVVQQWAQRMLAVLGIALTVDGEAPADGPLLLVANHISWLDILVMHAARHCRFVSKAEVRHWPLIGTLASGAGTLYIERESRRDAMRVVHHMAESLRAGDVVAVFPEGTTSDGASLLPFHGNLIQAAISAQAPVQTVALSYLDSASRQPSRAPIYVGDETLVGSLWRTLTAPPITAVVRFGAVQDAAGRSRRQWAQTLREDVERLRAR